MPCACQGKGSAARPRYEVIATSGKSVFSSTSKPTADAVARRYPNSEVRTVGGTEAAKATGSTSDEDPIVPDLRKQH